MTSEQSVLSSSESQAENQGNEAMNLLKKALAFASEKPPRDVAAFLLDALRAAGRSDVIVEMEEMSLERTGETVAQINYLQEIEAAAMELLDRAPDVQFDGETVVAEEAARIFSRVRLILPAKHCARRAESGVQS